MMMRAYSPTFCLPLILAGLVLGCGPSDDGGDKVELTVLAASALTDAFEEIAAAFEQVHPDVTVRLTVAGSQILRVQIEQGLGADVFASANESHMQSLLDGEHISQSRTFARNELVVIVPMHNPAGIESFEDLEKASSIVIGAENVPVGIYTREMLARARTHIGEGFVESVRDRVVSEESNVRLVRAKIEMGEADAAIVYRTDAIVSDRVRMVPLPPTVNAAASFPVGALTRSRNEQEANRFIEFVLSERGRDLLKQHGFIVEGE